METSGDQEATSHTRAQSLQHSLHVPPTQVLTPSFLPSAPTPGRPLAKQRETLMGELQAPRVYNVEEGSPSKAFYCFWVLTAWSTGSRRQITAFLRSAATVGQREHPNITRGPSRQPLTVPGPQHLSDAESGALPTAETALPARGQGSGTLTRGVVLDAVEVLRARPLHQGAGRAPGPARPDLVQGRVAVGIGTWRREKTERSSEGLPEARGAAGPRALGALGAPRVPQKRPAPPGSARLPPTLGVQGQRPAVPEQLFGQRQAAVGLQQAAGQRQVHRARQPRAQRARECAPRVAARDPVPE